MTTTDHIEVRAGRVNPLAVLSLIAGVLAIAGMIGIGIGAAAVFAVGLGHVALHQLRDRGGRGRLLAQIGLIIGYGIATWSLVLGLTYIPAVTAAF